MDILYTLGRGSIWQDNELRYSLRSIAKYGKNIGRVFLVGDWCPGFVNREKVTFIKCSQPYNDKFKNILYSVMYACENSDIAEDFLLSSDDHFYMQPADFDNYPYWLKNIELPNFDCISGYKRHLWETRCLLEKYGYDVCNYAQHCNTHFVKSVLIAHKDIVEESYTLYKGVEATCLMLNILQKERPFKYTVREDCKIKFPNDAAKALINRDCFSISDRAIPAIEPVLKAEFPTACIYENTYSSCVVIPIYKPRLLPGEERSVDQTYKILAKRPMFFFAPASLDTSYYEERYSRIGIKRFDDGYFKTVEDYSRLMETSEFYEKFVDYDYMLINQPDCWTFSDDLDYFCALGYDYIGAPWPPMKGIPKEGVGNGGFCLRRVRKFIDLCKKLEDKGTHPEDRFFCIDCKKHLNIAPMNVGAHFSLEHNPIQYFHRFGKVTPMGCHKPFRFSYNEFWKKIGVPDIR